MICPIAKRILHVCPKDRLEGARDYLKQLGGRATTQEWVEGDLLPRHILWLERTRKVIAGDRFIVEGGGDSVTRLIVGGEMDRVLEALAVYCSRYYQVKVEFDRGVSLPVRCPEIAPGEGVVFVKASALAGIWTQLLPHEKTGPSPKELSRMLVNLSGKRGKARTEEGRVNGYYINGALVLKAAEALGIGEPEEMSVLVNEGPGALDELKKKAAAARRQKACVPESSADDMLN
jgi:hypothetical protein